MSHLLSWFHRCGITRCRIWLFPAIVTGMLSGCATCPNPPLVIPSDSNMNCHPNINEIFGSPDNGVRKVKPAPKKQRLPQNQSRTQTG